MGQHRLRPSVTISGGITMDNLATKWMMILFASFFVFACGAEKQAEIEVEVSAALDGKPVSQAKVFIDGTESGTTDGNGYFSKRIQKQPGAEVEVSVSKDVAGYRIEPWKDSFVVKLPKQGVVDTYPFRVDLKGMTAIAQGTVGREEGLLRLQKIDVKIHPKLGSEEDMDKLERCKGLFEKYCIVTESIRKGLPVDIEVVPEIDRIIMIKDGRIFSDGSKKKLLKENILSDLFDYKININKRDGFYYYF